MRRLVWAQNPGGNPVGTRGDVLTVISNPKHFGCGGILLVFVSLASWWSPVSPCGLGFSWFDGSCGGLGPRVRAGCWREAVYSLSGLGLFRVCCFMWH